MASKDVMHNDGSEPKRERWPGERSLHPRMGARVDIASEGLVDGTVRGKEHNSLSGYFLGPGPVIGRCRRADSDTWAGKVQDREVSG
jgi:hypothetical protein